jgi:prepilin-type N-terminal cleavage/methylation domain-containing protein
VKKEGERMLQLFRKRLSNRKGFTLVELLVVISIIGILSTIAIPKFTSATEAANGAKMMADLRTIESAIAIAIAQGKAVKAGALDTTDNAAVMANLTGTPKSPGTDKKFTGPNHATATDVPAALYTITGDGTTATPYRAVCGTLKVEDI